MALIPITYYKNTSLEKAIDRLFVEADRAYRDGSKHPDPVRSVAWMRTMWQFRHCWQFPQCSST